MQKRQEEFAGKHSPETGLDPETGNPKEHEGKAEKQGSQAVEKRDVSLSQAV